MSYVCCFSQFREPQDLHLTYHPCPTPRPVLANGNKGGWAVVLPPPFGGGDWGVGACLTGQVGWLARPHPKPSTSHVPRLNLKGRGFDGRFSEEIFDLYVLPHRRARHGQLRRAEAGRAQSDRGEIGRASCRARECQSVWVSGVAVTLQKKNKEK